MLAIAQLVKRPLRQVQIAGILPGPTHLRFMALLSAEMASPMKIDTAGPRFSSDLT